MQLVPVMVLTLFLASDVSFPVILEEEFLRSEFYWTRCLWFSLKTKEEG